MVDRRDLRDSNASVFDLGLCVISRRWVSTVFEARRDPETTETGFEDEIRGAFQDSIHRVSNPIHVPSLDREREREREMLRVLEETHATIEMLSRGAPKGLRTQHGTESESARHAGCAGVLVVAPEDAYALVLDLSRTLGARADLFLKMTESIWDSRWCLRLGETGVWARVRWRVFYNDAGLVRVV